MKNSNKKIFDFVKTLALLQMLPGLVFASVVTENVEELISNSPAFYVQGAVAGSASYRVGDTVAAGLSSARNQSLEMKARLEQQCRIAVLEIQKPPTVVPGSDVTYYLIAGFSIICVPRNFGDQALMSLAQACQKQPDKNCFQTDILEKLNGLKPTTYITKLPHP